MPISNAKNAIVADNLRLREKYLVSFLMKLKPMVSTYEKGTEI
ncbi:MAG: hypothetical protein P9L91_10140 [Candidatus Zophobacter franzmannii]|nr:hypothetical protein [Candidatus Zophobacter franzmannii]